MSNRENGSDSENAGPQENPQNHDRVEGQHVDKPSQAEGDEGDSDEGQLRGSGVL